MGLFLIFAMPPRVASAHPHVFIDNRVKSIFHDGRLTGFSVEWKLDELFSTGVLPHKPADGRLSAADVARIRHDAFDNLRHYGYFIHVWQGARPDEVSDVSAFSAELEGGRLLYRFVAKLAVPLDVRRGPVIADFYDETYFVDVEFPDGDPSGFALDGAPAGCSATLREDHAHMIPGWGFDPPGALIACT
jgi:tRNA threonylcarbamoyladenosine biosynthesis protein TsaE